MSDPISVYQSRLSELAAAESEAKRTVRTITDAASLLDRWHEVQVSNTSGGYPAHLMLSAGINGSNWPNAEQLNSALVGWHNARFEAEKAWLAIPEDRRAVVARPPKEPT